METPKRILIFNVNWLGDVLFSTAAIRAVRTTYPESFIACAIPGRCYQILEGNPHVNEVIIFDEKGSHRTLAGKVAFIRFLARKKFDTVYLLHRSFSRALLCALAGIPRRIGHTSRKRAFLLTTRIEPPARDTVHRIDYYLTVVRQAGCVDAGRNPDLHVSRHDERAAADFLEKKGVAEGERIAVLNPGGNWMPKRWPASHWALLADRLIGEREYRVVFSGGSEDQELVREIQGMMKHAAVAACGALTIKQLGALTRTAQVFVTADSGPLHIAAAAGSRHIVALFGPTLPELTGPVCDTGVTVLQKKGTCELPCYEVGCQDNACMKRLSVDDVFAAVVKGSCGGSP
jgi:lipopolysaccharide heptosyltransferase II